MSNQKNTNTMENLARLISFDLVCGETEETTVEKTIIKISKDFRLVVTVDSEQEFSAQSDIVSFIAVGKKDGIENFISNFLFDDVGGYSIETLDVEAEVILKTFCI